MEAWNSLLKKKIETTANRCRWQTLEVWVEMKIVTTSPESAEARIYRAHPEKYALVGTYNGEDVKEQLKADTRATFLAATGNAP